MTDDDLIQLISQNTAQKALGLLAAIPQAERRKHAKTVIRLYKQIHPHWLNEREMRDLGIRDGEAVTVGLLATASLSELKKLSFRPIGGDIPIDQIIATMQPDWTQGLVDYLVEQSPYTIRQVQPLWQAGLCQRPDGDAIILGYYLRHPAELSESDEEILLTRDVWRFFEVEGGGEFSLANHEKYAGNANSWSAALIDYANRGRLDRQKLLDASLDALDRDFGQYTAGWYSRFHVALAPTLDEMTARGDRYLGLLASSVPPTVSFAIKHIQALDKAEAIDPGRMLQALEPALQARAKGTVTAAQKLVARAAKRDETLRAAAAQMAALSLVSEDATVQDKALDLIEMLGGDKNDTIRGVLADYVDLVAPSVRSRIAAMAGTTASSEPAPVVEAMPQQAVPVAPVRDADEALALFLSVLENPRDPFEVERAVDGLSRFGPKLQAEDKALSPLRKRATQICEKPDHMVIRSVLAQTGRALADGGAIPASLLATPKDDSRQIISSYSLQHIHLARNAELALRVAGGVSLPSLSLPSDTSGQVSVADLTTRMAQYRNAGVDPGSADLSLALMRLAPDGRDLAMDLPHDTEAERALAYTLGQKVRVGPTPNLWAAAWRARWPVKADPQIQALFKTSLPDCGIPASMALQVKRDESPDGEYHWIKVHVTVDPALPTLTTVLPAMFSYQPKSTFLTHSCCGTSYADIAWASLIRPADPEPFFRQALVHQDTWQKLTDNYTRAYLDPFFRPGPHIGPLGAAVPAYFLACEDKSVASLAAEAIVTALAAERLTTDDFSLALKTFVMSASLPTQRWTKGLATVAETGASGFVRDVITDLLDFPPEETPRDMGGMLELLYELHVAAGTAPTDPKARACLQSIPGGGKVAKFSKKLLAMAA